MSSMICIDFGNTYTKVGIRPDPDTRSEVLTDTSLSFDELNMCIPTLAGRLQKNGKESWFFGNDVLQYRAQTPGLKIYRNWKPFFFKGVETNLFDAQPARVASNIAVASGTKVMSNEEWAVIKRILNLEDDARSVIEGLQAKTRRPNGASQEKAPLEETDLDIKSMGLGFFRWLKGFVDPACRKQGLGPVEEIPVRITLPSFGSASKSELLLRELLEEAGWQMDTKIPALPEPLANAIGTFTEGINATHKPRGAPHRMPHYGAMFENTGLLQVIREAILADGPKVSWVMIADLGGYTLDFAMVALNLEDIDSPFDGTINGFPRTATYSEPIGVATLDRRIHSILSPEKKKIFEELENDPDQKRLESCHKILYGKGRGVKFRNVTIGVGAEAKTLGRCIEEFAEEIADCAQKFMEIRQYTQVDDLILTGGGTMIPPIRRALIKKLDSQYGVRKVHMYSDPGTPVDGKAHRMNQKLVRGATALGGASVYFDFQ